MYSFSLKFSTFGFENSNLIYYLLFRNKHVACTFTIKSCFLNTLIYYSLYLVIQVLFLIKFMTNFFPVRRCEQFIAPSHGKVHCSHINHYGSTCLSSCNTGYELIGYTSSFCQKNREWTKSAPICRGILIFCILN